MPQLTRTPLAWKNLTHDWRRLAVAISGVGFAVTLILMQLGFLNALLESTVQVLRHLRGELIIVSTAKYSLPAREHFDLLRVRQAEAVAGVKASRPFYMDALAVLRKDGARGYPIRVLAFDAGGPLEISVFDGELDSLEQPGSVFSDSASRAKFGLPETAAELDNFQAELNNVRVKLVGRFHLGTDFANDGNLVMTTANFGRYFPHRAQDRDPLSVVDLGVVELQPNADPLLVRQRLQEVLPSDVAVFTKDEMIEREKNFWRTSAPVGYIFLVGVYVGFVVGVIICYQIIYADIADHMKEFATLKAMGYRNRYFIGLVLRQALYLSVLGFLPGLLLSFGCYQILSNMTGLTMRLTPDVTILVLLVTMAMCVVSGMLAVRKLLSVDPASLF